MIIRKLIIGVDEVGRGCLAGDLVVCAFAFDPTASQEKVSEVRLMSKDSKAFSSRRLRERVVPAIERVGLWVFARRTPEEIDLLNIRGATLSAMKEASERLAGRLDHPSEAIFDGRDIPDGLGLPGSSCIKGDALVPEISCASILAKVLRDREMEEVAARYPGYGFEKNAGYGTKAHREAIARQGLTSVHRSWARKLLTEV